MSQLSLLRLIWFGFRRVIDKKRRTTYDIPCFPPPGNCSSLVVTSKPPTDATSLQGDACTQYLKNERGREIVRRRLKRDVETSKMSKLTVSFFNRRT